MNPGNSCVPTTNCSCCCGPSGSGGARQKLEPKCLPFRVCSPEMCNIFGGHDYNYRPDDRCPSPSHHSRRRNQLLSKNSLGTPIGVVKSSVVVKAFDGKNIDLSAVRYATYLKTFGKLFLTSETEWTPSILDALIKEGQQLYNESMNSKPPPSVFDEVDDEENPPELPTEAPIYSESEIKVNREFAYEGFMFQVELSEKLIMKKTSLESAGDEEPADPPLQFLKSAFKQFFRGGKYCFIRIANTYFLIWKAKGIFFIFDFNGRKSADFTLDKDKGLGMLICLMTMDNVCHLLLNMSGFQPTDTFVIRDMKMTKLMAPDGSSMSRDYGRRANEFEVISDDYAFLRSNLHLTLNHEDVLRSRSALPVAVAALIVSKIDHPATWNQKVADRIICYGVNVCFYCWHTCQEQKDPILLDQFPNSLKIGQFQVTYRLTQSKYRGTWKCVPNYKHSELSVTIEKCFDNGETNLLLQLGHQMYAIWKKHNFIYIFDPYRHRIVGTITEDNSDSRSASLRMFRTIDTFLAVFNQILLETNHTNMFYIHTLQFRKIEMHKKGEGAPKEQDMPSEEDADVKSLNDNICFEEDETQCRDLLGEISDYEEVDEEHIEEEPIVQKSSSDETEEAMEEEEGGMEDFGEFESSSSGGGHHHRQGRKKKKLSKKERDKLKSSSDKHKKTKSGSEKIKSKSRSNKTKTKDIKSKKDKKEKIDKDKSAKDKKGKKKGKKEKSDKEKSDKEKSDKDKKSKAGKNKNKKSKKDENDSSDDDNKSKKKKQKKSKSDSDSDDDESKKKDAKKKSRKSDDDSKKKDAKRKSDDDAKDKKKHDDDDKHKKKHDDDDDAKHKKKHDDDEAHKDSLHRGKHDERDQNKDGNKQGQHGGRDGSGVGAGLRGSGAAGGRSGSKFGQDDENGDDDDLKKLQNIGCNPNNYPGYTTTPNDMAVVGSESGSYESICKLLRTGFRCADRILTMTPWGNYVVFRGYNMHKKIYFLFDGCTCNVDRFRHLDLNCGTAGLLCFQNLHDIITYIIDSHQIRTNLKKSRKNIVDEICRQYCN